MQSISRETSPPDATLDISSSGNCLLAENRNLISSDPYWSYPSIFSIPTLNLALGIPSALSCDSTFFCIPSAVAALFRCKTPDNRSRTLSSSVFSFTRPLIFSSENVNSSIFLFNWSLMPISSSSSLTLCFCMRLNNRSRRAWNFSSLPGSISAFSAWFCTSAVMSFSSI